RLPRACGTSPSIDSGEQPMSRGGYSDDYDRGRGRDDDYDRGRDDDRGRRRDDDYDDRDRIRRGPPQGGMDGFFSNNVALYVLFGLCCGLIALIVGIIGLSTCQNPESKQNAMVCTIVAGISMVIGVVINIMRFSA